MSSCTRINPSRHESALQTTESSLTEKAVELYKALSTGIDFSPEASDQFVHLVNDIQHKVSNEQWNDDTITLAITNLGGIFPEVSNDPERGRPLIVAIAKLAGKTTNGIQNFIVMSVKQVSYSSLSHEQKVEIAQLLGIRELLRYGQINKGFNAAMLVALEKHTKTIRVPKLTEEIMVTLKKVRCLNLTVYRATDKDMPYIGQLTNLHTLAFEESNITDTALQHLATLTQFNTLDLSTIQITDTRLQNLATLLTQLHTLTLGSAKITDTGLQHLATLTQLHTLYLSCINITDTGLQHLTTLTQLHTLKLSHIKITDIALQHLATLTQLHTLDLSFTDITNTGLQHLATLTQLRMLNLCDTKITNTGLEHLTTLTQLDSFYFARTKITYLGENQLRKALHGGVGA